MADKIFEINSSPEIYSATADNSAMKNILENLHLYIPGIRATTVADAFYSTWIVRFCVPTTITTDQGRQFESSLFLALARLLGVQRIRTTEYHHPQSNGLIEEFHCPLKAEIMCHATEKLIEILPTILLGFRAALKENLGYTSPELVYDKTIQLPG
ncbi:gag-pol polyprotein [Trichonephila clavata]|uniref:Gag-pol polyprotein n=1 Tax=Trichonephila clavata TaxID=2740835 RepID=A0A8X6FC56_TRICU|nr:gag-pol polyprotein [Trichonephila clavata]